MSPETKAALEASIRHWEDNVADPENAKLGAKHCALCQLFHADYREDRYNGCRGCPVYAFSGETGCLSTPYENIDLEEPETLKAELDFLISLRED